MRSPRCKIVIVQRDDAGSTIGRTRCEETGIYQTEFADCVACRQELGVLWCVGHPMCIEHAAKFRADAYRFSDEPVDAVVGRMSADYARNDR
jgi:hypothetical protein